MQRKHSQRRRSSAATFDITLSHSHSKLSIHISLPPALQRQHQQPPLYKSPSLQPHPLQQHSQPKIKTFLFAYGSLIHPLSRLRTLRRPTPSYPCTIAHLHRSWSYPCPKNNYTAVGVRPQKGALCNGVLIPIAQDAWSDLDDREKHYTRVRLDPSTVSFLQSTHRSAVNLDDPSTIIYTYQTTPTTRRQSKQDANAQLKTDDARPSPLTPLPQSYLDVILSGCLAISPAFAADFLLHTAGWSEAAAANAWINDRGAEDSVRRYKHRYGQGVWEVERVETVLRDVLGTTVLSGRVVV
ncbi:hypothetical protein HDU85_000213 [Gaertneriomyces sp. JEL0708]|nr:hypothetical protein HDU85_000213 [Gaertneriomyces sp. JEL0708]